MFIYNRKKMYNDLKEIVKELLKYELWNDIQKLVETHHKNEFNNLQNYIYQVDKEIGSFKKEEFIDEIVKRIKKKQLNFINKCYYFINKVNYSKIIPNFIF